MSPDRIRLRMRLPTLKVGLFAVVCIASSSLEASAQAAMIDEGGFVVEQGGIAVATETFTIRSSGFGPNQRVIAQATLEWDGSAGRATTRTALLTDGPAFSVRRYESTVTGAQERGMVMESQGARFHAEVSTPSSTQEREFRASIGGQSVVVIDPQMPHHFYFLGHLATVAAPTVLSVISPQDLVQATATLTVIGTERLRIGGEDLAAQHLTLEVGAITHHIWLDVQNRVLRAETPELGLSATRRAAPER